MAEKILIVVDMQKDFVNGSLGSKDAEAIVPAVVKKAKEFDGAPTLMPPLVRMKSDLREALRKASRVASNVSGILP